MYLKYGDYQHDPAECILTIHKEAVRASSGVQFATKEVWDIMGRIHATDQASVNAAIAALQAAYSKPNQNAGFYMDDGTPTQHVLDNASSLYGVKVITPPSFPEGSGGEFSTYRNYHIILQVEYRFTGDGLLLSWDETITFHGTGGPVWHYVETLNGPPQRQLVKECSVVTITQKGRAEAVGFFPMPPGPVFPAYEHQNLREITPELPSDRYQKRIMHWTYHFSADSSQFGIPGNYIVPQGAWGPLGRVI